MAFLIRTVSHSAEGREIVRTRRVEGERLTVGRDPACEIHLTDLAVALRHAVVERESGRLKVEVEPGLSVELNGRKSSLGTIELATGGDILIASHVLRFMPVAAGSDEIEVAVERTGEGEVKLDKSAERLFTLAAVMPGKRGLAWLLALLVLAVGLAWPIKAYYDRQQKAATFARFHADEIWSSGSLSSAHAGLKANCTACHVKPFEAVRDTACKTCHTKVHDHADPFRLARARPDLGRWRRIELAFKEKFDIPPGRCVECHTEHEGRKEMPATAQRFCADCHGDLKKKLPDTPLPNAGDFGRSHPSFSPVLIGGWSGDRPILKRVSLARLPQEDSGLKFPHALHLSRSSGVAQMARRLGARYGFGQALECKDCHDPAPEGARFQPVDMEEDCAMCHDLAFDRSGGTLRTLRHGEPAQVVADLRDFYRGRGAARPSVLVPAARRRPGDSPDLRNRIQFARGPGSAERAIRSVFSPGGACWGCHRVEAPPGGSLDFRIAPVAFPLRYLHKGWFDHRAHATQSCSSCHAAERSSAASDLLIPDLASCRTCHGGEGSSKPVPSSCAMCHDYHMDAGAPSMLIRRQVRGKKRDSAVAEAGR
ncbi:MAG TPA: cytochrome c3 family protein [Allosphingosinicella sp.]|nr:cytochrome c3 family protein [Allosphingosinicella sp.]